MPLLDVLVCSTTDKFSDDVAVKSRSALSRFSEQRLISGARPVIDALEENLFNLATQLPNHMSVPGEHLLLLLVLVVCTSFHICSICSHAGLIGRGGLHGQWYIHLTSMGDCINELLIWWSVSDNYTRSAVDFPTVCSGCQSLSFCCSPCCPRRSMVSNIMSFLREVLCDMSSLRSPASYREDFQHW